MHDAHAMQQVASIQVIKLIVQHTSFQPYSSHTRIQWRVSFPRIFGLGLNINRGYQVPMIMPISQSGKSIEIVFPGIKA